MPYVRNIIALYLTLSLQMLEDEMKISIVSGKTINLSNLILKYAIKINILPSCNIAYTICVLVLVDKFQCHMTPSST